MSAKRNMWVESRLQRSSAMRSESLQRDMLVFVILSGAKDLTHEADVTLGTERGPSPLGGSALRPVAIPTVRDDKNIGGPSLTAAFSRVVYVISVQIRNSLSVGAATTTHFRVCFDLRPK